MILFQTFCSVESLYEKDIAYDENGDSASGGFTRRNDRRMDNPLTLASPSSTRLSTTITMSKQFQRSCR